MKIHTPEKHFEDGEIIVSAKIELSSNVHQAPEKLWFSLPKAYEGYITDHSDSFLSCVLLLAMYLQEDIQVHGKLSPRFLYGLESEYQRAFHMWMPDTYQQVSIRCDWLEPHPYSEDIDSTVAPFSGGVDSFYTLWSLMPQQAFSHSLSITHLVNIVGFDILLEDEKTWQTVINTNSLLADQLGLGFIRIKTNVRHFTDRIMGWRSWHYCFGSILIGTILLLGRKCKRFYIPAGRTYTTAESTGSLPQIDHRLSSETLEIFHHGTGVTRLEKTLAIANWAESYSRLRVCWQNPDGINNCCSCDKCIRTMLALELAGKLKEYHTFPRTLDRTTIRNRILGDVEQYYIQEIIRVAGETGRNDIVADLNHAIWKTRMHNWLSKLRF